MRVIPALVLPVVALSALLACAAPNPENDAPFIDLVSPISDRPVNGERIYKVFADNPMDVVLKFTDRKNVDGDFTVTLVIDPTIGLPDAGLEGRPEAMVFVGIPIDEDTTFSLADGFPEGISDLIVVANDDIGPTGVDADGTPFDEGRRVARFRFEAERVTFPTITPENPGTNDDLLGALPDPTNNYHEYSWAIAGDSVNRVWQPGVARSQASTPTNRGDVWEFCVRRWDTGGTLLLPGPEFQTETWPEPDVILCSQVTVGNTAPDAPVVTITPNIPNATSTLLCEATVSDPDGDAATIAYSWTNGTTTQMGQWLDPAVTLAGETWTCAPSATDDELTGPATATNNTVTLRAASVTLSGNLIMGGAFDPAPTPVLAVSSVRNNGAVAPSILAGLTNEVSVFRSESPTTTGFSLTGMPGFARAFIATDLDQDGLIGTLFGGDGSVYFVDGNTLGDGGNGGVGDGIFGFRSIQSDGLDPAGFGSAVAAGQLRSVTNDHGLLEVAAAWTPPVPPNSVLVFDGEALVTPGTTLPTGSSLAQIVGGPSATFGAVLDAGGDFTGNGNDDLAISDPGSVAGEVAVWVYEGGANLNGALGSTDAAHRISASNNGDEVGTSVVYADIDGDGIAELIIGAPGADAGAGAVAVFFGASLSSDADFDSAATLRLTGGAPAARLGQTLVVIPDPSGMFGDSIAIGSPGSNGGMGAVHVVPGHLLADASTTLASNGIFRIDGSPGSRLTAGAAGDIDEDGHPDLVVSTEPGITSTFWILGSDF